MFAAGQRSGHRTRKRTENYDEFHKIKKRKIRFLKSDFSLTFKNLKYSTKKVDKTIIVEYNNSEVRLCN